MVETVTKVRISGTRLGERRLLHLFVRFLFALLLPLNGNAWNPFGPLSGRGIRWAKNGGILALAGHGTANAPPTITTLPTNITGRVGGGVFILVEAGGSAPLAFQWMKNGNPIIGATMPRLILNNIQISDAATYHVVVSNAYGTVASAGVVLIVKTPLVITRAPIDQVAKAGADVSFTVLASGKSPITYRWMKDGDFIPGATTNVLMVKSVQESDAGAYAVLIISDEEAVRTQPAFLSIQGAIPPRITVQPTNQIVVVGAGARFSIQAVGGLPFSFQWLKDGQAVANGNSSNLTLSAAQELDAGIYSVIVTNQGGIATSATARLFVNVPPAFRSQPTNRTVFSGTNVTLAVEASGAPSPVFQWFKDEQRIPGGQSSSLTLVNIQSSDSGSYHVVATNVVGAATSLVAKLTVRVSARIKTQPSSQAVIPGQTATLTVEAEGDPPLMFQWFRTNMPIARATNAALILTNFLQSDAGSYLVSVSNAFATVVSSGALLTVRLPVTITVQPTDQNVFVGSNATFVVRATSLSPLTYQWFKDGNLFADAASPDLRLSRVRYSDAGNYFVLLSSQFGATTSLVARLTVRGPPVIERQPQSVTVAAGLMAQFLPLANGTSPWFLQWFKDGLKLTNATNTVLQFSKAQFSDQADYRFVVTNAFGVATSLVARLTVNAPPTIRVQPFGQTTLAGAVMRFAVSADGSPPLRYQWYRNDGPVAGGTNWILELKDLRVSDEGSYRAVVRNAFGIAESSSAILTVGVPASILHQPVSQTANVGASVTFGLATEGTPPLTYRWYKDGALIPRATNSVLTIGAVKTVDAGKYAVVVSNSFGQATGAEATLLVRVPLAVKGDFNRDGFPDIVFQNRAGQLASWFMEGTEMISADFLSPSGVADAGWTVVGSGDFDHDGIADLLFQNGDGAVALWFMRGRSLLSASLVNVDMLRSEEWKAVGTGDFDRDQRVDLVVRARSGRLGVSILDRLSVTSIILLNLGNPIDSDWAVAGTGDFNEDGMVDIVFQHQDGTLAVWYLDGTATSSVAVFNPSHPGDARWRVVGITDRNNDGRPDLLFQHESDGTLAVWLMDGIRLSGARLLNPSSPGGTWRVVAP